MGKYGTYPENSSPADTDLVLSVDVSDTTDDPTGSTKKLSLTGLADYVNDSGNLDGDYARLDGSNQPFTNNVRVQSSNFPSLLIDDDGGTTAASVEFLSEGSPEWKLVSGGVVGDSLLFQRWPGGSFQGNPIELSASGGVNMLGAASGGVFVPDASADGQALAHSQSGAVLAGLTSNGALIVNGQVTLSTSTVERLRDGWMYDRWKAADGTERWRTELTSGNDWRLVRHPTHGTMLAALESGSIAITAPVTVPAPTAAGQAVQVVAWDGTTGRYAVTGPLGTLEQGDTLWRNVAGDVATGWSATNFKLRRIGETVYCYIENLDYSSGGTTTVFTLPEGFRPDYTTTLLCREGAWVNTPSASETPASFIVSGSGSMAFSTSGNSYVGSFSWPTVDGWPTVLPGT